MRPLPHLHCPKPLVTSVFAPLRHVPFVSRREARYNSTLRIQTLIKSECALPSRIVKERQLSALHSVAEAHSSTLSCSAIDSRARSYCLEASFLTRTPEVVELIGIEPTTPCLQSRCSPKLSYSPLTAAVIVFPVT